MIPYQNLDREFEMIVEPFPVTSGRDTGAPLEQLHKSHVTGLFNRTGSLTMHL